jgi:hypothetical protein
LNGQIQYDFRGALTSDMTPVPDADLASRLDRFRGELREAGSLPVREHLERLLKRARQLDLRDEDIADERSEILACFDALELADGIARDGLPEVAREGDARPATRCHFRLPVRFGRRRRDQFGELVLTSASLLFHGTLDLTVVWSEIANVARTARDINVALIASPRILRFRCNDFRDAARGAVIARHLAGGGASSGESNVAGRPAF